MAAVRWHPRGVPATVDELVELFDLAQTGPLEFRGPQPQTLFQRLFGGQVLGQTLVAAARTVTPERHVHSLHAYFLRPGSPAEPLEFSVEVLRDGRTFSARRVRVSQSNREICVLSASFQGGEAGLAHSAVSPHPLPDPETAPTMRDLIEQGFGARIAMLAEWDALDVRVARPAHPSAAGGQLSAWVKTQEELPDDPVLHAAVLAYLSDITLLGVTTAQHEDVEFLSPQLQTASIDHAMWFHREFRADQWLLYDMASPSASGGRGFATGRLFQHDEVVASCAQEGLIRLVDGQ